MPRKSYIGKVVSNKMDKTVTVSVTRLYQHPLYKKTVKKITKLKAHDKNNYCQVGERVRILESRPLSKTKRWIVTERLDEKKKESENDTG